MGRCVHCGNDYDKSFDVLMAGRRHTFDSFECAVHVLAPQCRHCGCRILGHGIESPMGFYCCAHCARQAGVTEVQDRTREGAERQSSRVVPARRRTGNAAGARIVRRTRASFRSKVGS